MGVFSRKLYLFAIITCLGFLVLSRKLILRKFEVISPNDHRTLSNIIKLTCAVASLGVRIQRFTTSVRPHQTVSSEIQISNRS